MTGRDPAVIVTHCGHLACLSSSPIRRWWWANSAPGARHGAIAPSRCVRWPAWHSPIETHRASSALMSHAMAI